MGVGECLVPSLPGNREFSHLCHSPPTPTHAALLSVVEMHGHGLDTKTNCITSSRPTDDKNTQLR